MKSIFKTDRRIKLGIWGLGRGLSFYDSLRALNFDIVAGCDFNQHMRDRFAEVNPGALATDDADRFLASDIEAVLLATYCPAHADDAVRCLQAGKHVLSEVTSFHTVAEGVRLVEAVEKSGKVYNLAENYPFSASNMWLARKWKEGFFGDLMYAEYEYVHECRVLAYIYIDGSPINPGNQTHSWRSWLNGHYYNTHSLGPMMHITGLRPTRVTALPAAVTLPAYPLTALQSRSGIAPSLINMSNGSVVRNLMGATTNDTHQQRIWGTRAGAEIIDGKLRVRVGATGHGQQVEIIPHWDDLGDLAAKTGHGGGDFWVLYYFARNILFGEPGPFDIYKASDCTLQGILAYRSSVENGKPYDIPDFRDPLQRDIWRNDHFAQPQFDHREGLFPKDQDKDLTLNFSQTIRDLITCATTYRAYRDAVQLINDLAAPSAAKTAAVALQAKIPLLNSCQVMAKRIIDRYPDSVGARVLREMYEMSEPQISQQPDFAKTLSREITRLERVALKIEKRRQAEADKRSTPWISGFAHRWKISRLIKKNQLTLPAVSGKTFKSIRPDWTEFTTDLQYRGMVNVHARYADADGIVLLTTRLKSERAGKWNLLLGHDASIKVFVDGRQVFFDPKRINPASPDRSRIPLKLARGTHTLALALDTDLGKGWGAFVRFEIPKDKRVKKAVPVFPEWIA